jgi:hypothetical protein
LVDALGPPPASIRKHELSLWQHLIYPPAAKQKEGKVMEQKDQKTDDAAKAGHVNSLTRKTTNPSIEVLNIGNRTSR